MLRAVSPIQVDNLYQSTPSLSQRQGPRLRHVPPGCLLIPFGPKRIPKSINNGVIDVTRLPCFLRKVRAFALTGKLFPQGTGGNRLM